MTAPADAHAVSFPGRGRMSISAAGEVFTVIAQDFDHCERIVARFDRAAVKALRDHITSATGEVRANGVTVTAEVDRGGVRMYFNSIRHGMEADLPLTRDEAAAVAQAITAAVEG